MSTQVAAVPTTETQPQRSYGAEADGRRVFIELEDVYKSYGDLKLFEGLSITVYEGESVVVMGESGSGKSQLIALMNGLVLPDKGSVRIFGKDTREMSHRELMAARERIGTLFQNYALFDSMTVTENVAFPLVELKGMSRPEAAKKAQELLTTLGLGDAGALFPAELSGGMKKRVSLARAFITSPDIALFDEPTTGLDPVMIEYVNEMLIDAQAEYDLTSVIISHDMASAFKLADRMAMLHQGRITFIGTPDEARATTQEEVRRFVSSATSRLKETIPDAQDEATAQKGEHAQNAARTVDPTKDHGQRRDDDREAIDYRSETGVAVIGEEEGIRWAELPEPEETPIVTIEDVHKSFGDREVLKGLSFYVLPQKITTIIGGSGSGKSVLMKHILGLFYPTKGRVTAFGKSLNDVDEQELVTLRKRFGMLFQSGALFDSMTILENTMFPLIEQPGSTISRKNAREQAMETLAQLKIEELAHQMPADISSGQRKRAGLARAIVIRPEILIYDEPTTGLDPVMTGYVNDMIVEAQEQFNITALIVSHDMASTFRISHRVAMLYHGRIIAFGSTDDIQRVRHRGVREFIFAGAESLKA